MNKRLLILGSLLGVLVMCALGMTLKSSSGTVTVDGNLTVTGTSSFGTLDVGTVYLSNMVASVVPVFDANTNMVASSMTTNVLDLLMTQSGNLTNWGKLATNSASIIGSIGITTDGGSSIPSTGVKGYVVVPYTGHITGFSIIADGASPTCTWDVWITNGVTTLPTVSTTIMGTKPALSSGNLVRSTSVSTWKTNFTAGDILGFNLDAAGGSPTRITLTLETLR